MALLSALLMAATTTDASCAEFLDGQFVRLLALEWPTPPAALDLDLRCEADDVVVNLTAGARHREERVALPQLTPSARSRLLAVVISERGQAWLRGELEEPVRKPLAMPPWSGDPEPKQPDPTTSVPEVPIALLRLGATSPTERWRLGLGGGASFFALPMVRGQVVVHGGWGPVQASAQLTLGEVNMAEGRVSTTVLTLAPGVSVACVLAGTMRGCLSARLLIGLGVAGAQPLPTFQGNTTAAPMLGADGVVSWSVGLMKMWFVELDLTGGWTSGFVATANGTPVASVGGWSASATVMAGARWGP